MTKTSSQDLQEIYWSREELGSALDGLARHAGIAAKFAGSSSLPSCGDIEPEELDSWLQVSAVAMGFEVERIETRYEEITSLLLLGGPLLVKISTDEGARFVAIVSRRGNRILILDRQDHLCSVPLELIRAGICSPFEVGISNEINVLLKEAGVPTSRLVSSRRVLLRERLASRRFNDAWKLDLPPHANFVGQLQQTGSIKKLVVLTLSYFGLYVLWIFSWALIGRGFLTGELETGWFIAWALSLLTIIPLRFITYWYHASIAVQFGSLVKRRLLVGALNLDLDELRQRGISRLLGRAVDSEAVESLAVTGGFLSMFAAIELALGLWILWNGGGVVYPVLLAMWVGILVLIFNRFYVHRSQWTGSRIALTEDLIERMVGHRTRIIQERQAELHDGEDRALEKYFELSKSIDRWWIALSLIPRGWLLTGIIGLAWLFVSGSQTDFTLAMIMGGVLFCYRAFAKITQAVADLADASLAWRNVRASFSNTMEDPVGLPELSLKGIKGRDPEQTLIELSDVGFQYGTRSSAVLRSCNLTVRSGDRLLLEGASGSGKSTLASILAGERVPETGLVLVEGLDRHTLGLAGWRKRVVLAPQFHENHVLSESLAFNLLMGRRWPPHSEDLKEARTICEELGLGSLIGQMPSGLWQIVGETGWQLSHGERSRLFIARALLQRAKLVVLDESFASLDPDSLRQAIDCVQRRANALLVIAHP